MVNIQIETDKLGSERKQMVCLTLHVSVRDADISSFDPSDVRGTLSKRAIRVDTEGSVFSVREGLFGRAFRVAGGRTPQTATPLPRRREA